MTQLGVPAPVVPHEAGAPLSHVPSGNQAHCGRWRAAGAASCNILPGAVLAAGRGQAPRQPNWLPPAGLLCPALPGPAGSTPSRQIRRGGARFKLLRPRLLPSRIRPPAVQVGPGWGMGRAGASAGLVQDFAAFAAFAAGGRGSSHAHAAVAKHYVEVPVPTLLVQGNGCTMTSHPNP